MTRYLVTGGAGFIGSALVRSLVQAGHVVRVLDDGSRGHPERLAHLRDDIEFLSGDVRDESTVASACAGIDAICHLAAVNGTRFFYTMPERVLDVGIRGTLNVIAGALRHGVGRLYLASSSEVYHMAPRIPTDESAMLVVPDPLDPRFSYSGSKIASELLLLNYGRSSFERAVVFRPHNVYGPDMGWEHVVPELTLRIRDLVLATTGRVRVPIEGSGAETRAFCYIDDAVEGIKIVMERGEHRGIYHIGTDVETPIADILHVIARWYGRDAQVVPGTTRSGSPARRCPDITKLRALGYEPRHALEDGIGRAVEWYDAHAAERPRDTVTA